jgi:hypothetical protein
VPGLEPDVAEPVWPEAATDGAAPQFVIEGYNLP